MAKYNNKNLAEALKKMGWTRPVTSQDVANANKYGLKLFQKTQAKMDAGLQQEQMAQQPLDLLGIYKQAFGDAAGEALYQSLQAPTPLSNEQLAQDFGTQFNPYFDELRNEYGQDFATQTQRAQQDFAYNQANFEQQALQANQNAIGSYNDQFGDAFGSQMQLTREAQRQEALKRQREQMQQGFERRNYDLNQLNTRRLKDLENSRQSALGDYANTYRYSNVLG